MTSKGYFEIIEGARSDRDNDGDLFPDANATLDPAPNVFLVHPPSTSDLTGNVAAQVGDFVDLNFLNDVRGILGDTDDVWMATIRSTGTPFRGRLALPGFAPTIIESNVAEVVWWMEPVPGPTGDAVEFTLVRRVLLVAPEVVNRYLRQSNPTARFEDLTNGPDPAVAMRAFLSFNDISVRFEHNQFDNRLELRLNTLDDLSLRRNRFAHWPDDLATIVPVMTQPTVGPDLPANAPRGSDRPMDVRIRDFPHRLNRQYLMRSRDLTVQGSNIFSGNFATTPLDGNDVIASDVMAFDVRVFDPMAPVFRPSATTQYLLSPTDPGYSLVAGSGNPPTNLGAYVDLGYNLDDRAGALNALIPGVVSHFSGAPHPRSQIWRLPNTSTTPPLLAPRVYDSWTTLYEQDGINQDWNIGNSRVTDQAKDGLDNFNTFKVDGWEERETQPPYPYPLRGVEVLIRLRDFNTQQVRQASVVGDLSGP
jgi:hypothetical protein